MCESPQHLESQGLGSSPSSVPYTQRGFRQNVHPPRPHCLICRLFGTLCSQNKCLGRVPQKQSLRQGFCAVGCCGRPPAEGWSSAGWRSWLETALPDPARRPGPALRQGSTFCLLALASRWLWAVPAGKRGGRGWFPGEGAAVSISSQRRPQLGAGSTGWERGPETHPPPAQHGTRVTGRAHRSSPDGGFTKAKTSVIS